MNKIGFRIDEEMVGFHEFDGDFSYIIDGKRKSEGKLFMKFDITWGTNDILDVLNPLSSNFMTFPLTGTITIEDLCYNCPCDGTLNLYYHKGELCYNIRFLHEGRVYRYTGKKKNIRPWNLPISHTTCYGTTIVRTKFRDWDISKSVLYFNIYTIWDFLKSFRLV